MDLIKGLIDRIIRIIKGPPSAGWRYRSIENFIRSEIDIENIDEVSLKARLEYLAKKIEMENPKAAKSIKAYIDSGKWKVLLEK